MTADQVAGLHPKGEGPQLWTVGHLMFVPAETGPSDGDLEDEYISARFRVLLTEAEYRDVAAFIEEKKRSSPLWHAALYNCNAFVRDIALHMGLQAPTDTLMYPPKYINALAAMNR
ncbi:MAG: hypothetical protein ABWZ80_09760 [Beijerinckiaceae bacterium]